jgi:dynactin complex subunit
MRQVLTSAQEPEQDKEEFVQGIMVMTVSDSIFEKKCSSLKSRIAAWKSGNLPNPDDPKNGFDEALEELECMRKEYTSNKNRIHQLQREIMDLKYSLENEKFERQRDVADLNKKYDHMEKKYDKLAEQITQQRKLMLIRSMATAAQFQMTQKFPSGTFKTKYPYTCTFDNIKKKVEGKQDKILSDIVNLFQPHGIDEEDISECVKILRELGTSNSHPTEMIDAEGNVLFPNALQLRQYIEEVSFPNDDAKEAAIAVCDVLGKLHEGQTTPILSTALPTALPAT